MEVYLFHGPKMAEPTKRPALRVKTSGPLGTIYILSSRIYSIILKYIYYIPGIVKILSEVGNIPSNGFPKWSTSLQQIACTHGDVFTAALGDWDFFVAPNGQQLNLVSESYIVRLADDQTIVQHKKYISILYTPFTKTCRFCFIFKVDTCQDGSCLDCTVMSWPGSLHHFCCVLWQVQRLLNGIYIFN